MKMVKVLLAVVLLTVCCAAQQRDAGGVHAPTVALERGRTVFVTSSCHFCHGVDLTQTAMGAANLMHSGVVGADVGGNILGPIVKAGLPALQTSMPSYYEMTPQQITDLAGYVHYLRQMGKVAELMAAPLPGADVNAGKDAFAKGCAQCHTNTSMIAEVKRGDAKSLEQRMLLPEVAKPKEGVALSAGGQAHAKFTENASPADVSNLLGYLQELK